MVHDVVVQTNYQIVPSETLIDSSDFFELLPDAIVLFIFNKLADIKVLGRCSVVSTRFRELSSKVENVNLRVECMISASGNQNQFLNNLKRSLLASVVKPIQSLRFLFNKKAMSSEVLDYSPCQILNNFKEIQHLRMELPVGELATGKDVLLKWKAEFGSTLESCVILGASSVVTNKSPKKVNAFMRIVKKIVERSSRSVISEESEAFPALEENSSIPDNLYADDDFKQRLMWIISSIIASSARHFLLRQIISDHPALESLVLTDAAGEGTLCMGKQQLQKLRNNPAEVSTSLSRTQVPAMNMRLWYTPYLEVSEGIALKGATLVAMEPRDQEPLRQESSDIVHGAFEEEPFNTVTSRLSKRHAYLLEMNSF